MQNFPSTAFHARHNALIAEAACDRRAAEVRDSSGITTSRPRWMSAIRALRLIATAHVRRKLQNDAYARPARSVANAEIMSAVTESRGLRDQWN